MAASGRAQKPLKLGCLDTGLLRGIRRPFIRKLRRVRHGEEMVVIERKVCGRKRRTPAGSCGGSGAAGS